MCIIVAKVKGVKMPSRAVLRKCWDSNIDGAGFSVGADGAVLIKKGFMQFEDFYAEAKKLRTEDTVVMHFRRTTQGGTSAGLTHPFPLSAEGAKLRELCTVTDCAISHNGDIPMTGTAKYKEKFPNDSDTLLFIKNFATKLFPTVGELRDAVKLEILTALIGPDSKMAIHTADGIKIVGHFNEEDGLYFSNFTNAKYYKEFTGVK
jgi:predicted glutamine amidotransferase